jgi:hypothetical protein
LENLFYLSLLTRGCTVSPGLDIPATINYTRNTWTWDDSLPSKEDLVGMNATLGISIMK